MRSVNPPPLLDRIARLYLSRQFVLYVACGLVSSAVQLVTRYVVGLEISFSAAVIVAYVAGMVVALLLYRTFVFESRPGSLTRQTTLFVAGYLAFMPVTWGISVAGAAILCSVLAREVADTLAHVLGVAAPVALNFAFNKAVTFEGAPAPRGNAAARVLRAILPRGGHASRAAAPAPEIAMPALAIGPARCAHRSAE